MQDLEKGQGSGPALQFSSTVSFQSRPLLQDKKGKAVAVDQDLHSTRRALEVLLSIPSQDICRRSNTHLELALSVVESVLVSAKGYIIQRHQQLERLQVGSPYGRHVIDGVLLEAPTAAAPLAAGICGVVLSLYVLADKDDCHQVFCTRPVMELQTALASDILQSHWWLERLLVGIAGCLAASCLQSMC